LATRIQLCGRLVATIDGKRVERELAGMQARLLFAYLVLHRLRASSHHELIDALWAEPPRSADSALYALVSRLRRVVGAQRIEGRSELRLVLAEDAWVDVEAAHAAVHRAESAAAHEDWPSAWVAARIAQHIAVRPLAQERIRRPGSRSTAVTSRALISALSSWLPRRASGSAAASSTPPSGLRESSSSRLPSGRAVTGI